MMKKPMVFISLSFLIGIMVGMKLIIPTLFLVVLIMSRYNEIRKIPIKHGLLLIVLCIVSIIKVLFFNHDYNNELNILTENETSEFIGIVKSINRNEEDTMYEITPWFDESGKKMNHSIRMYSEDQVEIGNEVIISGKVYGVKAKRNEGGFDQVVYGKSQGYIGSMYGNVMKIDDTNNYRIRKYLDKIRVSHGLRIQELLPEKPAEVISTLLLGLKNSDTTIKNNFRVAGLIHILAISGLHITLIGIGLFNILVRFLRKENVCAVLVISFLGLYCIYTGLHVSTIRATVMIGIYLGQYIFVRRYDKTSALFVAVFIIVVNNPYELMSVGFLLSFAAVFSIFYITPKLGMGEGTGQEVLDSMRIMVAIWIGITPLLIYYFYYMPVYSLIVNFFVLPIIVVIIAISIVGITMSYIVMAIGKFIISVTFWLVNYMLIVTEFVAQLPYSYINVGKPHILVMVLYYTVLIVWVSEANKYIIRMGIMALFIVVIFTNLMGRNELKIRIMDVGQGDCAIISYSNKYMMIDSGGDLKKRDKNVGALVLKPFYESQGINCIDTVFITHSDYDHIYGIMEIMDEIKINQIILSANYKESTDKMYIKLRDMAESLDIAIVYFEQGDQLEIKDLSITCLGPNVKNYQKNNNDNSLVLHLELDEFDALFLGDIGQEEELRLLEQYDWEQDSVELLKVAHHGSVKSSAKVFIQTLEPDLSVVSVGANNMYGHPSESVMISLDKWSDRVKTTEDSGEIIISYKNGVAKIDTMIK